APVDELALVIRLPAANVTSEDGRPVVDPGLELRQRHAAVERGIASRQDVEIDPVEDDDLHRGTLIGYQLIQSCSNFGRGPRFHGGPVVTEQYESQLATLRLLVALQRGPRTLTIEANRFRSEDVLDGGGRPAGQPEGGDETKRNCVPVGQAPVTRCSFECVRKRVAEVEDRATALIEGIAQAHCRL